MVYIEIYSLLEHKSKWRTLKWTSQPVESLTLDRLFSSCQFFTTKWNNPLHISTSSKYSLCTSVSWKHQVTFWNVLDVVCLPDESFTRYFQCFLSVAFSAKVLLLGFFFLQLLTWLRSKAWLSGVWTTRAFETNTKLISAPFRHEACQMRINRCGFLLVSFACHWWRIELVHLLLTTLVMMFWMLLVEPIGRCGLIWSRLSGCSFVAGSIFICEVCIKIFC